MLMIMLIRSNQNIQILNFGSQSSEYLKKQPYILENIVNPVESAGHKITNLDIRDMDGVDLAGDLFDDKFFARLKAMKFDVVFVFNLLANSSCVNPAFSLAWRNITPSLKSAYPDS